MKSLKNNKVLLVLALILIICFALILLALFKYFYSGRNASKYGDRLENSQSYKLSDNLENEIKSLYKDDEINEVEIKVSGKIVYLTLNLSAVKKLEDSKSLALKALEKFSAEEMNYYDIQFIITCDSVSSSNEVNLYPTMGYKNSSSSVVVWIEG